MKTVSVKWLAIACLSVWLSACGMAGRYTEPEGAPPKAPTPEPSRAEIFYVGHDRVPLYPQPAFSSKPTAHLTLNEKVSRSKQEKGFAYVTVVRTGRTGWVENSKPKPKRTPPPVAPPAEAAPAISTPPPVEKKPAPATGTRPDASIFDAN